MSVSEDPNRTPDSSRTKWLRLLAIVVVIVLSALIFINRGRLASFGHYGYPGIFLIAMAGSATVLMPMPGIFFTSLMGTVFNPFLVALAAGLGAGLGEMSGYLAGYSGQGLFEKSRHAPRLIAFTRKYGIFGITLLAMIPNPAFDVVGITAGVMKMPVHQFLIAAIIGNVIKMLFFAYGGTGLLKLLGLI